MFGKTIAGAALLSLAPLAGALAEEVSQTRDVAAFTKIKLSGSIDADVTVGEAQSVTITADAADQERIETEVRDGTLYIKMKGRWRGGEDVDATITVPALEGFSISGSSDAVLRGIDSDSFKMAISGSGDIAASGRCGSADFAISGSGDIAARQLQCGDVKLAISGSGDAEVYATDTLSFSVSGSGDIDAWGGARVSRARMSGSGDFSMHEK